MGVDDYLKKPFEREMLLTRLTGVMQASKRLAQANRQLLVDGVAPHPDSARGYALAFMQQFSKAVETQMSNPNLTMDALALELAVSRSVLFRKVREATGVTPAELIKQTRLSTAHRLLVDQPDLGVGDVARAVGFADVKYFGKCFAKAYGKSPTAARREAGVTG